jgi:hypothetical protein
MGGAISRAFLTCIIIHGEVRGALFPIESNFIELSNKAIIRLA